MDSAPCREIRQALLRLLGRREYSRRELELKYGRQYPAALLAQALDRLEQDGCLSDRRFAEVFVRSRIGQGYGLQRIRFELKQKGIAAELLEMALAEQAPDWFALARASWSRRFRQGPTGERKELARQMRYLLQRGFSQEEARAAIDAAPVDGEG